jgi:hypothetical protein
VEQEEARVGGASVSSSKTTETRTSASTQGASQTTTEELGMESLQDQRGAPLEYRYSVEGTEKQRADRTEHVRPIEPRSEASPEKSTEWRQKKDALAEERRSLKRRLTELEVREPEMNGEEGSAKKSRSADVLRSNETELDRLGVKVLGLDPYVRSWREGRPYLLKKGNSSLQHTERDGRNRGGYFDATPRTIELDEEEGTATASNTPLSLAKTQVPDTENGDSDHGTLHALQHLQDCSMKRLSAMRITPLESLKNTS